VTRMRAGNLRAPMEDCLQNAPMDDLVEAQNLKHS
jgi:hypothetical protein